MITQYFDINARQIIQAPGTLAAAGPQTWVYGDNYNLAVYLTASGVFQPIAANDILGLILFQPASANPQTALAIIGQTSIKTDPAGYQYYQVNVNLLTTALAALVQTPNRSANCEFHYTFNPADGERFSSSADIPVTVNPDPTQSATGATPVPPGYPTNPNVFEQVANKNVPGGYAGLDTNAHSNPNQIPTDTTLHVVGGLLGAVAGAGGNPYVATITASFTIPAQGALSTALTLSAPAPDMVAGQSVLITDGVRYINGILNTVTPATPSIIVENTGGGTVSGTMNANSHVYLGNAAALATTTIPGLITALSGLANQFLNGQNAFASVSYLQLTNVPSTFAPATHGSQHVTGGNDLIPLVSPTVEGLCPPIDNSTIIISAGKLVAQPPAGGGNPYVATLTGTPAIPAAGASQTYTLSAIWADFSANQSCLITDAAGHFFNGIITAYAPVTPSITVQNLGTNGSSVSGNFSSGAHVYLGNSSPLATATAPGIAEPDGTTISIAAGKLSAIIATGAAPGIVRPDNSSITISGGVLTATPPAGIIGQIGCRMRANASQTIPTGGVLTQVQFQVLNWDTTNLHAGTSPNFFIQIPAAQYGVYEIVGHIVFAGNVTGGTFRKLAISLNASGAAEIAAQTVLPPPASFGQSGFMVSVNTIAYLGTTPPNGTDSTWPGIANPTVYLMASADVAVGTVVGGWDGAASLMVQRIA